MRITLPLGSASHLTAPGDGSAVYLTTSDEQFALLSGRELFSFGAGSWADGPEASEAMADSQGRWLSCNVTMTTMVIVERKRVPAHLQAIAAERAMHFQDLVRELEDAGQARTPCH